MRVAIPHDLPQAEVTRRLKERSHEIADHIPGGMATVTTGWPADDRMSINVNAMGNDLAGMVNIEDNQVVFEIALPIALSFVEPIIAGAIRQQGQKMLEAPSED
ncbi:polyhydroxyalkanoic acid system family protein [Pontixanthobacter sp. CEM42]|uniref:polyhydroxyalkanoic acid system family protein n=1 Tax=Pontixanthobacter sp. CEM42 TaxID=2792077 RepID=UPI001AE0578E|nr:polyhydroxyalkanoic acid system family protein [Pontixanthobacter sp. CEM42]